ncbi:unnamed protein product [Paramecium pentaurelia]|uniref:Uncharacterized protein n=1 Tax=Paramecium pentaurelia TaxID=43138 RepID=A0A8S1WUZ9_9CILI|nr:unnamed protein product [Paramecium pentaurelia]
MLRNIINIIQEGQLESKDIITMTLNSCAAIFILISYFVNYHLTNQRLLLLMIIQIIVVLHFEISFYENHQYSSFSAIVYLISLQQYLYKQKECFHYLSHSVLIYAVTRSLVQKFNDIVIWEFILILLWQPFNHYLLHLLRRKKYQKKEELNSQVQFHTLSTPQAQHTERQEEQPTTKVNLAEDFFDCIPEGLVILDEFYKIIRHNSKILHYLNITDSFLIPQALDGLFKIAQKNRSPQKEKKKPIPLKQIKQRMDVQSYYTSSLATSLKKQFWMSDKEQHNFGLQKGDSITYPFLQSILNDFKLQNLNENMTITSECSSIVKYQILQETQIKQRHLQIKIYDIKMTSYQNTPLFLFIVENITNKEQLKLLTNRFKFQQALLNSFSHELRTPLNCTLTLLQALKNKLKNDDINNEYLNPSIVSSQRLLYQINDILDYAQLECQDFQINITEFRVGEVFQTLKDFFEQECKQKQIELIIENDCLISIRSDKDRITQVLINLINNSIKFTSQGGRIVINLKKRDNMYQFTVWDNGKGISNITLANIFESQKNMNASIKFAETTSNSNKLGLGLKVSRGIVKYLCQNGDLVIKSQKDNYTSINFFVEDQIIKVNEDITEQESIMRFGSKHTVQKCECPQILIVDDIPFNHIAMIAILTNFGIKSESAYDGTQAIEKVILRLKNKECCKTYRIIFMDIEMPGKNGFQTSAEIVEILKQSNCQSVIVMCSAYTGEANVEQARKCGMKEIIPKPIAYNNLQLLISKYFQSLS